jgi:peptide/nickel transport system substrate-binding protein
VVALLAGCGDAPPAPRATPVPSDGGPPPSGGETPAPEELPFQAAAWPVDGSACDRAGYTGLLGRIEAVNARTVRFTLCEPDGALPYRLALPALAILDTATVERLAADRSSATAVAGTGPYRIDQWTPGDNVRLVRVAEAPVPGARSPTVIIRWAADPAERVAQLEDASVDGIDAPGSEGLDALATQPEVATIPRDGLATAYLAFGKGAPFGSTAVRRAIAGGLDRDALVAQAFPPGSTTPTHVVPCSVQDACGGGDWYPFDGPASTAALVAAGFDFSATYPLHLPDQAVPGLPDPLGVASAVQAQLEANLGLHTAFDVMPVTTWSAGLADGSLGGLYLGGIEADVPEPGAFLAPLLGSGVGSQPARRARGVAAALADAAATSDEAARAAAFARANDAIRRTAALVPLAHPGTMAAFRADIEDAATSPLGLDPLGTLTPGDRKQLVFMQATEPDGAYCGDHADADANRLCGLVLEGLFGFAPGTLRPEARLAMDCVASAGATVWTCHLVPGIRFQDGARLDAGDVLASFVAQWDPGSTFHPAVPGTSVAAWPGIFGSELEPEP